jgi:hypothetical protein
MLGNSSPTIELLGMMDVHKCLRQIQHELGPKQNDECRSQNTDFCRAAQHFIK